MIIENLKIFPEDYDKALLLNHYKWMWEPQDNLIVVSPSKNDHRIGYLKYKMTNPAVTDFTCWIRFVHLIGDDFREKHDNVICVRQFPESLVDKCKIIVLLNELGIKDEIYFGVTNEKIRELTKYYAANY